MLIKGRYKIPEWPQPLPPLQSMDVVDLLFIGSVSTYDYPNSKATVTDTIESK